MPHPRPAHNSEGAGCPTQDQPTLWGCPIHFAFFAKWVGDHEPPPASLSIPYSLFVVPCRLPIFSPTRCGCPRCLAVGHLGDHEPPPAGCPNQDQPTLWGCPIHFAFFAKWVGNHEPPLASPSIPYSLFPIPRSLPFADNYPDKAHNLSRLIFKARESGSEGTHTGESRGLQPGLCLCPESRGRILEGLPGAANTGLRYENLQKSQKTPLSHLLSNL